MKPVQFFAHETGRFFTAIVEGQHCEKISYHEYTNSPGTLSFAQIEYTTGEYLRAGFYEVVENGFSLCSREAYLIARRKAQAATAQFFGEQEEFTAPPVEVDSDLMQGFVAVVNKRPTHIDRPNAHHLINDLPF